MKLWTFFNQNYIMDGKTKFFAFPQYSRDFGKQWFMLYFFLQFWFWLFSLKILNNLIISNKIKLGGVFTIYFAFHCRFFWRFVFFEGFFLHCSPSCSPSLSVFAFWVILVLHFPSTAEFRLAHTTHLYLSPFSPTTEKNEEKSGKEWE